MKIQLDTENKTIKLESTVSLKEFMDVIKKLLPNDWQKFSLETNVVINNCSDTITIKEVEKYPIQNPPFWSSSDASSTH